MADTTRVTFRNFLSHLVQTALGTARDDELINNVRKSWRRRVNGLLLLAMYLFVFYIVIMSLTAYQIQNRIHQISADNTSLNIWAVTQSVGERLKIEQQITAHGDKITVHTSQLGVVTSNLANKVRELETARGNVIGRLLRHGVQVPSFPPPTPQQILNYIETAQQLVVDDTEQGRLNKSRDGFQKANSEVETLEIQKRRTENTIRDLQEQLKSTKKRYQEHLGSDVEPGRVSNIGDQLRFFFRSGERSDVGVLGNAYRFLFGSYRSEGNDAPTDDYLFVTLPSEVLVMLVVIAMGTMGSMISITQVFFAGEDRPITFYMFRPLLGGVVAIGVYVLTKAGVIVASNLPQQASGTAELNAFFVSFVSLVAGLMSDSAINMMKSAGASFMRGDPVTEKARYASRVKELMAKDDNKTAERLYAFFGEPKEAVDDWLEQKEPVPGDAQRVIAAWLDQPVREVFSDIPPPVAPASNAI